MQYDNVDSPYGNRDFDYQSYVDDETEHYYSEFEEYYANANNVHNTEEEEAEYKESKERVKEAYYARKQVLMEQRKAREKQRKLATSILTMVSFIIVVAVGVLAVKKIKGSETETQQKKVVKQVKDVTEKPTEETTQEPLNNLVSATDEINNLIKSYYSALIKHDVNALSVCIDNSEGITQDDLVNKTQYVESYDNIECLMKNGLYDDTYVVYASYDMKLNDIETPAPTATVFYVINKDGKYIIHNGSNSADIVEYIQNLSNDEDVIDFNNEVDSRFEDACEKDENLALFYENIRKASESTTVAPENDANADNANNADNADNVDDNADDNADANADDDNADANADNDDNE